MIETWKNLLKVKSIITGSWIACSTRVHYDLYHSYFILFWHTSAEDC